MNMAAREAEVFELDIAQFLDDDAFTCYAIVDKAQDKSLLDKFRQHGIGLQNRCLLPAALDSESEDYAPHLLELSPLAADSDGWMDILQTAARHPASFTLLASRMSFDNLWKHLARFTEIYLPDDTEMILAFWDPAVLGTLVGQVSDSTLHVPAQVLSEWQRAQLLMDVSAWWYWDRDGNPQKILPRDESEAHAGRVNAVPFKLTQTQVDMLVEAGLPDQLLSLVNENQPQLLMDLPEKEHYRTVENCLLEARKLKLTGMRDILNYTCAALIYGNTLKTDSNIAALLREVKQGHLSFDAAMEQFP